MSNYVSLYEDQIPLPTIKPSIDYTYDYKPTVTDLSLFNGPTVQDSGANSGNRIFGNCINSVDRPMSFKDWKEQQDKVNQQQRILPYVAEKKQVRFEPMLPMQSLPAQRNLPMAPHDIGPPLVRAEGAQSLPANMSSAPIFQGLEMSVYETDARSMGGAKEPQKPLLAGLYKSADMSHLAKLQPPDLLNSQPIISQPGKKCSATKHQPIMGQPLGSQPILNQQVINQPLGSQPITNQPIANQPVMNQPIYANPIVYQAQMPSYVPATNSCGCQCPHYPSIGVQQSHFTPQTYIPVAVHGEVELRCQLNTIQREIKTFQEQIMQLQTQVAELRVKGSSPVPPSQRELNAALQRIDAETQYELQMANVFNRSSNTTDQPIANSTDKTYFDNMLGQVNQLLVQSNETTIGLNSDAVKFIDSDISAESIKLSPKGFQPTTRAVDKSCVINALAEKYLKDETDTLGTSNDRRRSGGSDTAAVSTTCYNYLKKYDLINDYS